MKSVCVAEIKIKNQAGWFSEQMNTMGNIEWEKMFSKDLLRSIIIMDSVIVVDSCIKKSTSNADVCVVVVVGYRPIVKRGKFA